ncbi:hypothetical protein ACFL4J_01870, partial [Candidatus Margulisiibacteriota bacterium]
MAYQTLAKPFAFYVPKPDICNFPTQNAALSKDFNFLAEFFKFAPKMLTVAMEDGRIGKKDDEGEFESGQTLDGWPLSDEWVEALNEYEVTSEYEWLYDDNKYSIACDDWYDWPDWSPRNNIEALEYRDNRGENVWNWSRAWVAGNYHFNAGLFPGKGEWYWGEAVASTVANADFKAEGWEWNHLEQKQPLGIQGMFDDSPKPKDTNLDADVASNPYFINGFLSGSGIGAGWSDLNSMLKSGGRQNYSYYQLVMNSTQSGRASYKGLSTKNRVLLVASMIESRNRAYSAMEKIFGPAWQTWDDQAMMDNFSGWLSDNAYSGASQGINAMRLFLHLQHFFSQALTTFTWPKPDRDLAGGMLDCYAFPQFAKDLGAEKYFNTDFDDSGGKTSGAIFDQISADVFGGGSIPSAVMSFLRADLKAPLSIHTRPSDIDLSDYGDLGDLSSSQRTKLQAYKWLLEQWFGSQKIDKNYNAMPNKHYKVDSTFSNYDLYADEGDGWDNYTYGSTTVRVPDSISKSNSNAGRSYGWDRVTGPWAMAGYDGIGFLHQIGSGDLQWAWEGTDKWNEIYGQLRSHYGTLPYISPYTGTNH